MVASPVWLKQLQVSHEHQVSVVKLIVGGLKEGQRRTLIIIISVK